DVEEQAVLVVAAQDLHADGQAVDRAGRDRHRRVAVDVGDDGQGAHVHHVGELGADEVHDLARQLGGEGAGHPDAGEAGPQGPLHGGLVAHHVQDVGLGAAGGRLGGEGRARVGGGDDEV